MCIYVHVFVVSMHVHVCAHVCVWQSWMTCTFIRSLTVELERTGSAIFVSWKRQSRKSFGWRVIRSEFISTTRCTSLWPRTSNNLSVCFLIFCFLFSININWTFTVLERVWSRVSTLEMVQIQFHFIGQVS